MPHPLKSSLSTERASVGIVEERVFASDRRYRNHGVERAILQYSLIALFFALGKFEWANRMDYEFGNHAH